MLVSSVVERIQKIVLGQTYAQGVGGVPTAVDYATGDPPSPPVAGYAVGEHEPGGLRRRNRPAYDIVDPITHRYTTYVCLQGRAQIASRYLDSKER
jgi:hypothetical protein